MAQLITLVNSFDLDAEDFTAGSWARFNEALGLARALIEEGIDEDNIDEAEWLFYELAAASSALVYLADLANLVDAVEAELTPLWAAILAGEVGEDDLDEETTVALMDAFAHAIAVRANPLASREQIVAARDALIAAVKAFNTANPDHALDVDEDLLDPAYPPNTDIIITPGGPIVRPDGDTPPPPPPPGGMAWWVWALIIGGIVLGVLLVVLVVIIVIKVVAGGKGGAPVSENAYTDCKAKAKEAIQQAFAALGDAKGKMQRSKANPADQSQKVVCMNALQDCKQRIMSATSLVNECVSMKKAVASAKAKAKAKAKD